MLNDKDVFAELSFESCFLQFFSTSNKWLFFLFPQITSFFAPDAMVGQNIFICLFSDWMGSLTV